MRLSPDRRVGDAGVQPNVGGRTIPSARIHVADSIISTPDNHLTISPNCRMPSSTIRRVGQAGSCPAIGIGVVLPTAIQSLEESTAAPDDHFSASPHRRMGV